MRQIAISGDWKWQRATNGIIEHGNARVYKGIAVTITITAIASITIATLVVTIMVTITVSIPVALTIPIGCIIVAVAMLLLTNVILDVAEFVHITWLGNEACDIRFLLLLIEVIPGWGFAVVGLGFPLVATTTSLILAIVADFD